MSYKVKRFSKIREEKLFASLSDIRKKLGSYEGSIASHLCMFLTKNKYNKYWSEEIIKFLAKEVGKLDKKMTKNYDYSESFPYYLGNDNSRYNETVLFAKKKILSEDDPEVNKSYVYLESNDLVEVIKYLVNELNKLKNKLNKTLSLDRKDIELGVNIMIKIYNKYHNKFKL